MEEFARIKRLPPYVFETVNRAKAAARNAGADTSKSSYSGPTPGGHDGYVVQPVQNDNGFRVEVFDAADVSAGPVAVLAGTAKECVPMVL